jgi:hypothetical protein
MVSSELLKQIRHALADALPHQGGDNLLIGLEVRRTLRFTRLPTKRMRPSDTVEEQLKSAIDATLNQERHRVQFHWE